MSFFFERRKHMFFYPANLANVTKEKWDGIQKMFSPKPKVDGDKIRELKAEQPPFPTEEELNYLLDVIYHASFLTEESRRIAVRVAYILPQAVDGKVSPIMNHHNPPIPFNKPISFSVSEILRLAPAVDPTNSIIVVGPAKDVGLKSTESALAIWGILNQGSEWWRVLTGRDTAAFCPPNILTVSAFAPGNITASTMGFVLFRLRAGELLDLPLEDLSKGFIGAFLKDAAESLYLETCKKLQTKRYYATDFDDHPRQQYFRTLTNIINLARERGHGGTFVIISDEITHEDQRLQDRMTIKYPLNLSGVWDDLIEESIASRNYFNLLFPKDNQYLLNSPKAPAKKLKELIWSKNKQEHAQENITNFEQFVSSLSGVDGAVVLSKRLKVLGFGAEIMAISPSLKTVKIANDPDANKFYERPINSFGTRHRSALRLCSSFEDLMCLVISQDGAVRAIKRVGPNVYMWNDVSLGKYGL
ncbi:DNA integrity scanning protein DisA nucleotide-binding domain protein [Dethiobacter alkaliphilus]|uniref:DNA integrity scanning protein DisA nucleotide-binding domain protein n=1 Tax=Dethiobacter alkaliphilus TaxID=427926 RepID=UPI002226062D|nr:DNA integrity scanning protein DisA nucleotide-binding domain protein [Dethiobacter alkaliphilus]